MSAAMPPEMGPLPQYKRTAELQRLSIQALRGCLPVNRILFRGEPDEDAGVDGELEVLFDGHYANCRSKVQLKATDTGTSNKDGSVSLSVETSNLNYLLNGPSPLYILYVDPRGELRYAWAWDEMHRIERENPDWKTQGTITLRFVEVLDEASLDKIREKIIRESLFKRQVTEMLGRAEEVERVTLHVNPGTLGITDPAKVRDVLLESGMTLVAGGYSPRVIEAAALLGPTDLRLPGIQLILAFAQFTQSRLNSAYGHLQEAMLRQAELTEGDRDFLAYLRDACDVESGRITHAEYAARKDRWTEAAQSRFGLIHRLECLGYELSNCSDVERLPGLIDRIRAAVAEILANDRSSNVLRLEARLKLEYAQGVQVLHRFSNEVSICHIRALLGPHLDPTDRLRRVWGEYLAWEANLDDLFQQALQTDNYRILGEAAITRALVRFILLSDMRLIGLPRGLLDVPKDLLAGATTDARLAADLYRQCGYFLGELRANMLLVDYLELSGMKHEAQELAREIQPVAEIMGFEKVVSHVGEQLNGESQLHRMEAKVSQFRTIDQDESLYLADDKNMEDYARATMAALDLPEERHPVVLRECRSMREEARAKYYWCRHFQLIYDPRLDERDIAQFRSDPVRLGACAMVRKAGGFYRVDTLQVIKDFKEHVCAGCPHRAPKAGEI
jgi:hypothetical protein